MLDYLAELELPTIVVLTKIDKISRSAASERARDILDSLSLSTDQLIPFSSATGEGRDELAAAVASLVDVTRGEMN
jgi:GTP-binding protein